MSGAAGIDGVVVKERSDPYVAGKRRMLKVKRERTEAARVALSLSELLERRGLVPLVKSSGATGLHVVIPLAATNSFDDTRVFARSCALVLEEHYPKVITASKGAAARRGKVLIDWQQNGPFRSVAAPYSLRVSPLPFVAAPLTWDEVRNAVASGDPSGLLLLPDEVALRIQSGCDPWGGSRRRHAL